MIVIVEEEVGEISSSVVAGPIRASVSPFTSDSLNEAFSFAVGLRAIRFCK